MLNNRFINKKYNYKLMLNAMAFAVSLSLGLIAYYLLFPNLDSDILWSMAVGKWISLHASVPVVDSFSWTIYGKEWLTHEWLFSYLAYYLHTILGNWGFYMLIFIPVVITIYVLYLICDQLDTHYSYAFIIPLVVGITFLYKASLPFRAYIFGLMFFTILIYLLYFMPHNKKNGLYLFALFVLWANFHVSVCVGILILVVEMIRKIIISRKKVLSAIFLVSSICATLINPYGYKIWKYFYFTLTKMGEAKSIAEWQAADFNDLKTLFVYLLLAVSVLVLHFYNVKGQLPQKPPPSTKLKKVGKQTAEGCFKAWAVFDQGVRKISDKTCLLVLFWAFYIYSLYSVRMLFYAIVLWIIVISIFMGQLSNLNFTKRTYFLFAGLFVLWFAGSGIACGFKAPDITVYNKNVSPVEEVQFLKENPKYQINLFNDYIYGGYLILNNIPVFIDARSDSYIKFGVQQKYGDVVLLKKDPQEIFDEMQVRNIIITNYSPLDRYLTVSPRWALVYRGPSACIYTLRPE